ncbi:class I SAM-dependent methyltransferase [Roseovarius sp. 2305UL8-3]|uniref:class I SAM-dependent methyltransferase n=1 Tax=Roseovarius conchicola TaxID=3121636 RepID=UPI003528D275
MSDVKGFTQANKAAWDASAPAHEAGEDWSALVRDVARPGFSVFDATMTAVLRQIGVEGLRVVQIGCNNGRELLSLPSLGALPVLGIDQSSAFLDQARRLADIAGSDCAFLEADIYALPEQTPWGFDLALITIGVLNWMPDLPRFFEIVAGLLAPRGRLVIYETHPVLEMFEPEDEHPFRLVHSYFKTDPFVENEVMTYDGTDGGKGETSYWFLHNMGDVVTSCVQAGLVIESLTEYPHSNREVAYDKYEGQDAQLPLCYTLVAQKG